MAKLIPLTRGKSAIVDDADFEVLSRFRWYAKQSRKNWYAMRFAQGRTVRMHSAIMDPPARMEVDHIDRDSLDNRRTNLRLATKAQQQKNTAPRTPGTFKGVSRHRDKHKDKWVARVVIGYYDSPEDAARAYDRAAKQLFGEHAYLNFPDGK